MNKNPKCESNVEAALVAQIKELREMQLKLGAHHYRKYMRLSKQIVEIASLLVKF